MAFNINRPKETDLIKGSADVIRENFRALLQDRFIIDNKPPTAAAQADYLYFDTTSKTFYRYDGTAWQPIIQLLIENLYDVIINKTSLNNNQVLCWDSTNNKWVNNFIHNIIDVDQLIEILRNNLKLGDLKDINIDSTTLAEGSVLQYDDSSKTWKNKKIDSLDIYLKNLKDVKIVKTLENRDRLEYDTTLSKWKNISYEDIDTKNTAGANETNNKFYPVGVLTADIGKDYGVTKMNKNFYIENGKAHLGSQKIGEKNKPVYINNGEISAIDYEINKTVPSDALFTDTTYTGSDGIKLDGTTFKNSGVRSINITGGTSSSPAYTVTWNTDDSVTTKVIYAVYA